MSNKIHIDKIKMSSNASISFEIFLTPEVVREYYDGLSKIENAKNGSWKPPIILSSNSKKISKSKESRKNISNRHDEFKSKLTDIVNVDNSSSGFLSKDENADNIQDDNELKEFLTQVDDIQDDNELKEFLTQVVNNAFDGDDEKDNMKKILPDLINIVTSGVKSMEQKLKSDDGNTN